MVKSTFANEQLKSFIARIERLEEERAALSADVREVYAEAKGTGFDTKIMRKVIAMRKLDRADAQEQAALLDLYLEAVGFDTTPLARAAAPRPAPSPKQALPPHDPQTGEIKGPAKAPKPDEDTLYASALALVTAERNASTSFVQRKLGLGYNHAAAIIERMEQAGVISPPNSGGKREIMAHATNQSQAKADADAPAKATTQSAAGEESVSRGAGARSPAATTEIMVETGGERAALELPAFMDRRAKPPPQPVA